MKSANLVQIGKIVIDEHCPEPKLTAPEQTLVRVRYAAINADDYSAFAGYLGRFYNSQRLLHEFSGEIVALGPQAAAQGFAVGDHVSCNILRGCGVCPACCFSFLKSGFPRFSPSASRSPRSARWRAASARISSSTRPLSASKGSSSPTPTDRALTP